MSWGNVCVFYQFHICMNLRYYFYLIKTTVLSLNNNNNVPWRLGYLADGVTDREARKGWSRHQSITFLDCSWYERVWCNRWRSGRHDAPESPLMPGFSSFYDVVIVAGTLRRLDLGLHSYLDNIWWLLSWFHPNNESNNV